MIRKILLLLALAPLLGGCNYLLAPDGDVPGEAQHIYIQCADDMNESSPLKVDVVLATSDALVQQLSVLSASTYFMYRDQLLRDYPTQMMTASWEVVPGQRLEEKLTPGNHDPYTGFVFADYRLAGIHRGGLPPAGDVGIQLQRSDFTIMSLGGTA